MDTADSLLTCFIWIYMVSPRKTPSYWKHVKPVIPGSFPAFLSTWADENFWDSRQMSVPAEFPYVNGTVTISTQVWCLNVRGWGFGFLVETEMCDPAGKAEITL